MSVFVAILQVWGHPHAILCAPVGDVQTSAVAALTRSLVKKKNYIFPTLTKMALNSDSWPKISFMMFDSLSSSRTSMQQNPSFSFAFSNPAEVKNVMNMHHVRWYKPILPNSGCVSSDCKQGCLKDAKMCKHLISSGSENRGDESFLLPVHPPNDHQPSEKKKILKWWKSILRLTSLENNAASECGS